MHDRCFVLMSLNLNIAQTTRHSLYVVCAKWMKATNQPQHKYVYVVRIRTVLHLY